MSINGTSGTSTSGCASNRHLHHEAPAATTMARGGKREGAQRILDALATKEKMKTRVLLAGGVILLATVGVAYASRWEFALATLLMCGMLLQYAVERMNTIVDAGVANGLKTMGWEATTELTEETLATVERLASGTR